MISDLEKRLKRNERNKFLWSLVPFVMVMCIGSTVMFVEAYKEEMYRQASQDSVVVTKDNVADLNQSISNGVSSMADIARVDISENVQSTEEATQNMTADDFIKYMYSDGMNTTQYKYLMQDIQYYNIDNIDWTSYAVAGENNILYELDYEGTPIFLTIYFDDGGIVGWDVL